MVLYVEAYPEKTLGPRTCSWARHKILQTLEKDVPKSSIGIDLFVLQLLSGTSPFLAIRRLGAYP